MDPKIDTLSQVDTRDLVILGDQKIVLLTFSMLFGSCLGNIETLFLAIKGLLLVVFSAKKVYKCPQKFRFSVKNLLILAVLRGRF